MGCRVCIATAVLTLAIATVPLGSWMITALENRFPVVRELPPHIDGVIALGGVANQIVTNARGQVAISDAVERLTALASIGRQFPDTRLVFSGGSGLLFHQEIKEGDILAPFLADIGLDPNRVEIESGARNTYENAIITREFAAPAPEETWVLITSAFHMPRAVGCFRKAGWTVLPYPVDFKSTGQYGPFLDIPNFSGRLSALELAVHEWLGLIFYWLTGRIDEVFPHPQMAKPS
jgi:uncharacterized SAM-binding protein YcdF (DUF218 family)